MIYPSMSDLVDKSKKQCRYSLVVAVAKRARELEKEAENNGEMIEGRAVSAAIDSFADGEATYEEPTQENA